MSYGLYEFKILLPMREERGFYKVKINFIISKLKKYCQQPLYVLYIVLLNLSNGQKYGLIRVLSKLSFNQHCCCAERLAIEKQGNLQKTNDFYSPQNELYQRTFPQEFSKILEHQWLKKLIYFTQFSLFIPPENIRIFRVKEMEDWAKMG